MNGEIGVLLLLVRSDIDPRNARMWRELQAIAETYFYFLTMLNIQKTLFIGIIWHIIVLFLIVCEYII